MYTPLPYREERPDVLAKAVADIQFGALITAHGGAYHATHVPMLLRGAGEGLVLDCHIARANPHWQALPATSMAIFQGPHAYVSPSWYEAKQTHGRVVPTWNYIAVHAHGALEVVTDKAELIAQLEHLTDTNEAHRDPRWRLSDAPAEYVEQLSNAIVSLRLKVERLEGTWKMNQRRPAYDRTTTIEALAASPLRSDQEVAAILRDLEAARGDK